MAGSHPAAWERTLPRRRGTILVLSAQRWRARPEDIGLRGIAPSLAGAGGNGGGRTPVRIGPDGAAPKALDYEPQIRTKNDTGE